MQADRDWAPRWQNTAKVIATTKDAVPIGAWREQGMDDIGQPGALGFHTDEDGQPVAYVDVNEETSVTFSHEFLEMLGDRTGNRLVNALLRGRLVRYLLEVADPIERFTYLINGIKVSNFIFPEYVDSPDERTKAGVPLDHMGILTTPMTLATGGYLSYKIGNRWFQDQWFQGSVPTHGVSLNMEQTVGVPLRTQIDQYMMKNFWSTTV